MYSNSYSHTQFHVYFNSYSEFEKYLVRVGLFLLELFVLALITGKYNILWPRRLDCLGISKCFLN